MSWRRPGRTGLAVLPDDTIDASLNEVESLAQKAARGAGLPWGVAEDAGRSAVWLARHLGACWAPSLLALLQAPPPPACSPLLLAGPLADGAVATAEAVVAPAWLLPVLLLGPGRCNPVVLRAGAAEVRCNPLEDPRATVPAEALAALPAGPVAVGLREARLPALPYALPPRFRRSLVAGAVWARLESLAALTYVPASTVSRLRGAGAGLLDDE